MTYCKVKGDTPVQRIIFYCTHDSRSASPSPFIGYLGRGRLSALVAQSNGLEFTVHEHPVLTAGAFLAVIEVHVKHFRRTLFVVVIVISCQDEVSIHQDARL